MRHYITNLVLLGMTKKKNIRVLTQESIKKRSSKLFLDDLFLGLFVINYLGLPI